MKPITFEELEAVLINHTFKPSTSGNSDWWRWYEWQWQVHYKKSSMLVFV